MISHIPCGTKFLRVLIFAIFSAICKNKFPQVKINIFPAKIYAGVNTLWLKFVTQKYCTKKSWVRSITTCLFHSETTKYWFTAWKYVFLLHKLNINENIINAFGTGPGYWVLSENRKKLIPSKKSQSVLIAKISSRKTQKLAKNSCKNFVQHGMYPNIYRWERRALEGGGRAAVISLICQERILFYLAM